MSECDSRDWREYAYLTKENWPEAIPYYGPKREYGPYSWGGKSQYDPLDVDKYPWSHPDAASVGELYMGEVYPMCGVPLKYDERVVTIHGDKGDLHEVSPDDSPQPCYHPECWKERESEYHGHKNATLGEFA